MPDKFPTFSKPKLKLMGLLQLRFRFFTMPVYWLLFALLPFSNTYSQVINKVHRQLSTTAITKRVAISDTSPVNKAILKREIRINPQLREVFKGFHPTDTSYSAAPYLTSKAGCEFEKSIDDSGCVIVKYADGLTKKICNGDITEIITPDGRRHIIRVMKAMIYVMKMRPPDNPSADDAAYKWIGAYNNGLLNDIKLFLGESNKALTTYLQNEQDNCGDNLYKQIEYRTIFIEEFLKAK